MTFERPRSPLRLLAPLALVAFALAFFVVLTSSGVDSSSSDRSEATQERQTTTEQQTTTRRERRSPATYTVKEGDTLAGIAETTGVTLDKLLELNPDIDPQGLVSGQQLKLRE